MDKRYNDTRRIVKTDYKRERIEEEPQRKTKTKIHSTNNKETRMRLKCTNKKKIG